MSRYPASLMVEARRLHDAEWKPPEITRLFQRRGTPVTESTIRVWVDVAYASKQREWTRSANARARARRRLPKLGGVLPQGGTDEYREARAQALMAAGLTPNMVARAMCFDFDDPSWTEHRVRRLMERAA